MDLRKETFRWLDRSIWRDSNTGCFGIELAPGVAVTDSFAEGVVFEAAKHQGAVPLDSGFWPTFLREMAASF